jgi:RNA polymerase sigma-70 factor (ECF subfamily)
MDMAGAPGARIRRERARVTQSDESLLLDYARNHRAEALETLVSRHWPGAFRLALRFLGDRAAAEDVAQEAFVKLLRSADGFEEGRSFLPWFRTLVLNAARDARRSGRSRSRHERAFAKAASLAQAPEGEGRVAALELDEHLAALDVDVAAPLVLHYFEGCSHDEVAATLGCPKGTASSRIRRGLEQLRESLAGTGAALSLVELERICTDHAKTPIAAPKAPSVAGLQSLARGSLLGGLGAISTAKALVLACVVVAGVTGVFAQRFAADEPGAGVPEQAGVATASSPARTGSAAQKPEDEGGAASAAAPADPAPAPMAPISTGRRGFAFFVHDVKGQPVPGARCELRSHVKRTEGRPEALARFEELGFGELATTPGPTSATTDAGGRAFLEASAVEELGGRLLGVARRGLDYGASGYFARRDGEVAVDVMLRSPGEPAEGTGSLLVTVLANGEPLSNRTFKASLLFTVGEWSRSLPFPIETDERGRFAVPGLVPSAHRIRVDLPGWRETSGGYLEQRIEAGKLTEVTIALEKDDKASVTGRIVSPTGRLPEEVFLYLVQHDRGSHSVSIDADGRFDDDLREPGRYSIVATAHGLGYARATFEFKGEPVDLGEIALGSGATVTGRLLDGGAPVVSACLLLADDEHMVRAFATTGEDGRFRVAGVAEGRLAIVDAHVQLGDRETARGHRLLDDRSLALEYAMLPAVNEPLGSVLVPAAGEVSVGDLVRRGPRLAGHVTGPDGQPVGGAKLEFFSRELGRFDEAETDASGAYALHDLPPGSYEVATRAGDLAAGPTAFVIGDAALVQDVVLGRGGTVFGKVSGPKERLFALERRYVTATLAGTHGAFGEGAHLDALGGFRIGGLAPGHYVVSLSQTRVHAEVDVVAGAEVEVPLALADRVGFVKVSLKGFFKGPWHLYAFANDAAHQDVADVNGRAKSDGSATLLLKEVPEGELAVIVHASNGMPGPGKTSLTFEREGVRVLAGETTEVELAGPGVDSLGSIKGKVDPPPAGKRVTIYAEGEVAADTEPGDDGTFTLSGLPPGAYKLTAQTGDVKGREVPVTVEPRATADAGLVPSR